MQLLKIFIIATFLIVSSVCFTKQDLNYPTQLQQLCKKHSLTFFSHSLIKTIKGNSIQVLGISASADKSKNSYYDYKNKPAILLTGAMHPRQDTSFRFIKQALQYIIQQYSKNNKQIRYLLQRIIILVVPFVNIDGIKFAIQNNKNINETNNNNNDNININNNVRKNMNIYTSQKCKKQSDKGVDINRNFAYNYGKIKTSQNPCGQQYRGIEPFSQSQSQAIRKLFQQFHITTNIDIHSYGNLWIYPYASQENSTKIQQHQLYNIYQHIFYQFQKSKINYANCYESLKYVADGVYIDWALYKGSVSFALQFGDDFYKIGNQLQKHINAIITVMKINIDFFQYFIQVSQNEKKIDLRGQVKQYGVQQKIKKLCIKSLSTLQHSLQLLINGENIENINIKSRETECFSYNFVAISGSDNNNKNINTNNNNNIQGNIKDVTNNIKVQIKIKNTQIIRQLNIKSLKQQKYTIKKNPHFQSFLRSFQIFFITVGVLCLIGSLCGLSIFCQNSIGMNGLQNQDQNNNLHDHPQIIEGDQSMESADKIKRVSLKEIEMDSIEYRDNSDNQEKTHNSSQEEKQKTQSIVKQQYTSFQNQKTDSNQRKFSVTL